MKKFRAILALLLAGCMVFGMAACSLQPSTEGDGTQIGGGSEDETQQPGGEGETQQPGDDEGETEQPGDDETQEPGDVPAESSVFWEDVLDALFGDETPCAGSILTSARQAGAVQRAAQALERTLEGLDAAMTTDAVLTDVEEALEALGEITGRTMREEVVNRIFSRFCVGK